VASLLLLIYIAVLTRQTVHNALMSDVATISGAATVVFLMLANALWAATAKAVHAIPTRALVVIPTNSGQTPSSVAIATSTNPALCGRFQ
jgi:hypothetical protein